MNLNQYSSSSPEEVLADLQSSENGLSENEVLERQARFGKNEIKKAKTTSLQILTRQFKSSFFYLLGGAFVLSLFLGELIDAILIAIFVVLNTILGFFQEYRSEQTMKLLKKYLSKKTRVKRDGEEKIVDTIDLVPGDLVLLEPGDVVPADIRILDSFNLNLDESVLTGESVSVYKDRKVNPMCYSGTTVLGGSASGVVASTGKETSYANIVKLTTETEKESTYEKEISKLSKFIVALVAITLIIIFAANFLLGKKLEFFELTIFAIALAVSVIPEALPVVTTFSLSIGARRLAKKKVVVKRLSAIEDLGSVQILCTDKTGTLTENNLKVEDVLKIGKKDVLLYASLASEYKSTARNKGNTAFEVALLDTLNKSQKILLNKFRRIQEMPFDPFRKKVSCIVSYKGSCELVVRGMPEDIINSSKNCSSAKKNELMSWTSLKGKEGIRVLAVATKDMPKKQIKKLDKEERELTLLGLVAFTDPIKPTTKKAIANAKRLGVDIKILTGDSAEVAEAVAWKTGLTSSPKDVITGAEFEKLSGDNQIKKAKECIVFARVSPELKHKIIQILEKEYEVGFLGEGINDAPALKAANVALAVEGASDIAQEASDLVLMEKSLSVIVDGIKEGRTVYANTNKYITATLSANFGNFFAVAIVSLLVPFLPMLPLQILLVNLLSDFPMISIATDSVDPESVKIPRRYDIRAFASVALVLGVVSSFFDFVFFASFVGSGQTILQTSWFIGSILTELVFIYSVRTNKVFWKAKFPSITIVGLTLIASTLTLAIPYTKLGDSLFRFTALPINYLVIVFGIVIAYFITTESVKNIYYRYFQR